MTCRYTAAAHNAVCYLTTAHCSDGQGCEINATEDSDASLKCSWYLVCLVNVALMMMSNV